MADFYLKSSAGALPLSNGSKALGSLMVPVFTDATSNHLVAKKWVWECTTAGTSNGTPTWPASVTQDVTTVTQNGVVWTARKPGFSSGSTANWSFATIYFTYAASAMAPGDRLFVSHLHAESLAAVVSSTVLQGTVENPVLVTCVNDAQTDPALMTEATGALVNWSGVSTMNHASSGRIRGMEFRVGSGSASGSVVMGFCTTNNAPQNQIFENCTFQFLGTSSTLRFLLGSATMQSAARVVFRDCAFRFSNATQGFSLAGIEALLENCSGVAGTALTGALFMAMSNARGGKVLVENCYLTNFGTAFNLTNPAAVANGVVGIFRNCKTDAAWTGSLGTTDFVGPGTRLVMTNVGPNTKADEFADEGGHIYAENTVVMTGGSSDGTTVQSFKMVSSASAKFHGVKCVTPDFLTAWNTSTGSPITATVEVLHDSVTALTDRDIYLEVLVPTSGTDAQWERVTDADTAIIDGSGTAQTSSSQAWTTTGLTNPNKQKLQVTFTPAVEGAYIARVVLAKPSYTVYVNRRATLA